MFNLDISGFTYAYTVMTTVFIVVWAVVFIFSRHSRPAIFWTSLILCFAGPVAELWLIPDYWNPVYIFPISINGWHFGAADIVISFAAAGIAAGVFEQVALRTGFTPLPHVTYKIILRIFCLVSLGFLIMVVLASVVNLIHIYALLFAVAIPAIIMLYNRVKTALLIVPLGVVLSFLFWLLYLSFIIPLFPGVIEALWNLDKTLGITLAGIHVEEMLWAFTTVLFAGPVYRICCSDFFKRTSIYSQ